MDVVISFWLRFAYLLLTENPLRSRDIGQKLLPLEAAMARLTKRHIDSLRPREKDFVVWDSEMPGFGLRVKPSGRKSFVVQYRNAQGRSRRLTVGIYGHLTPAEARKEARLHLADADRGQDPAETRSEARKAPTMNEFSQRYLSEHSRPKKKPASVLKDEQLLRLHILPALGTYKVGAITKRDVVKLVHSMGKTPNQANRALALLSKMFNLAEAWGVRPEYSNPCRHVEKFPEKSRERFLTSEELANLGHALKQAERADREMPSVITAIRLLLLTGARVSEILTLKWSYVDFKNKCLRLPDSKTGRKVVALGQPALQVLNETERLQGNDYVCYGAKPGHHLVEIRRPWHRIREKAGLPDVRMHDLRHSFASVAASAGLGAPLIGGLLGHADQATTQKYIHLSGGLLGEAADKVAGLIGAELEKPPKLKVVDMKAKG